jgi:anti-sigma regulatory factor (Ser/Thr protein kinase)
LHCTLERSSPREVRRAFESTFASSARLDDLLLCLSEVVTNAVLHALPPITVVGCAVDGVIRVEVSDRSAVTPVQRAPDVRSPTGRGLWLLDTLSSAWGVDVTPGGKTVWFEIEDTRS